MQRIKTLWNGQFSNILAEYHQLTKKLMTDSSTMSEGESFRVFLGHFITTMESMDFKNSLFYMSVLTVLDLFPAKLQLLRDIQRQSDFCA